jgi:hypothetical protein
MRTRSKKSNVREQEVLDDEGDVDIGDEDDQDTDFDIMDSHYDTSEGDNDLYAHHIDEDEDQLRNKVCVLKRRLKEMVT